MNLLLWQETHPTVRGGADTWFTDTSEALVRRGHTVAELRGDDIAGLLRHFKPDVAILGTLHGFVKLDYAVDLLHTGIPAVWMMHDYWPFCVKEDETVFANYEPIPIQQVELGDTLLGSGEDSPVTQTFKRGYDGEMIGVKPQGLWEVSLTPEHPIQVVRKGVITAQRRRNAWRRYNQRKKIANVEPQSLDVEPEWVKAGDLQEGDYLCIKPISEEQEWEIDLDVWAKALGGGARRQYQKIQVDEEVAYLLGWYLAEGSSSLNPVLDLGSGDEPYIPELIGIIEKCGIVVNRQDREGHSIRLYLSNRPLARMLRELFGHNAREKRIPKQILTLPKPKLTAFLVGYLRGGDGSVSSKGNNGRRQGTFVTASRDLMQGLCLALFKVGIVPSVHFTKPKTFTIKGKTYTNVGHYAVSVSGPQLDKLGEDSGTRVSKRRFEIANGLVLIPIKQLRRYAYKGKVYNFETGNHTFDLPFITHNCGWRMLMRDANRSDLQCEAVEGICRNSCGFRYYLGEDVPRLVNCFYLVTACVDAGKIMYRHGLNMRAVVEEGIDTDLFKPGVKRKGRGVVYASAAGKETWKGVHILEQAVEGTGLEVRFLTGLERPALAEELGQATIYAFPSLYQEIWGLALTEAMACGCAVVASDVAGARAQIHDGLGILVPPRDPEALRKALLAMAANPARAAAMGEAARRHVVADHGLAAIGQRWESVCGEVLRCAR